MLSVPSIVSIVSIHTKIPNNQARCHVPDTHFNPSKERVYNLSKVTCQNYDATDRTRFCAAVYKSVNAINCAHIFKHLPFTANKNVCYAVIFLKSNFLITYLPKLYYTPRDLLRGYIVFDRQSINQLVRKLLYCYTEFLETVYGIKTHYVDVHILNWKVRFH